MKFKKEKIQVATEPIMRSNLSGITACLFKGQQFGNEYQFVAYHPISEDLLEDIRQGDYLEVNGYDKTKDNKTIHIINSFILK